MNQQEIAAILRKTPVPPDISKNALLRFRNEACWTRDRITEPNGTETVTLGAWTLYYDPHFNAEVAARIVEYGGNPNNFDVWTSWANAGFEKAKAAYRAAQPPGPEDPQ